MTPTSTHLTTLTLNRYTRKQFAAIIGKSSSTIKRMEKQGIICGRRTSTGSVYYTDADVAAYFYPDSNTELKNEGN